MSELMQLETGISIKRYLPPSGTAGLARRPVSGYKRWPAPPPSISASTLSEAIRYPPEDLGQCCCRVEQSKPAGGGERKGVCGEGGRPFVIFYLIFAICYLRFSIFHFPFDIDHLSLKESVDRRG